MYLYTWSNVDVYGTAVEAVKCVQYSRTTVSESDIRRLLDAEVRNLDQQNGLDTQVVPLT